MTNATKISDVKRAWHLVDAQGKTLGRLSTEIAKLLMGKSKPYFVRNLDCGDYVVVLNASGIKTSGNKDIQKKYYRYSGYPGGLSVKSLQELKAQKPEDVVQHAVKGMLPQNRLRDRMLVRLHIYADANHPYEEKFRPKADRPLDDKGENK